jgi:hypothetical protein
VSASVSSRPSAGAPRRGPSRSVGRAVAGLGLVLALAAGAVPSAGAVPPTTDGPVGARYAAAWVAAGVTSDGSVHTAGGNPSPGATLMTALSLAAAGTEAAAFQQTVTWLAGHVDAVIGAGVDANPGQLGFLLLVVDAAGLDATSFGGVDLVARLGGTLGQFEPGLYGKADPTYDGAFRQGMAILGLASASAPESAAALDWLASQQCTAADQAVHGAWQAYRAPAATCQAPDLTSFSGVDTNSTAVAFEAMVAAGRTPAADALGWLDRAQNATGGWGYLPGLDDDPNSTALALQAIVAGGASPTVAPWVEGTNNALSALLAFQLGCDAPAADRGAFTYPGTDNAANSLATQQGIWGASLHAFPLGAVTFGPGADPCAVAAPTTTTSTTSTTKSTREPSAAAPAVTATPAFTG